MRGRKKCFEFCKINSKYYVFVKNKKAYLIMFNLYFHLIIFIILLKIIHCSLTSNDDIIYQTMKIECKYPENLITSISQFEFVEIFSNDKLILQCHYCSENDNGVSKIWYKITKYNITPTEVELGMNNNITLNRIVQLSDHSLVIKNVTNEDAGIYFCYSEEQYDNTENMYRYIVDVVSGNSTLVERGDLISWNKYYKINFEPINNKFLYSNDSQYVYIRNILKINMEMVTEWEQDWDNCDACGKSPGKGTEEKVGYCRVKIVHQEKKNLPPDVNVNVTENIHYLLKMTQVSCHSLFLKNIFPYISNVTMVLPNFVLFRYCNGVCNPDVEGKNKGWKFGSTKGFKYRKVYFLSEKEHLTAVCPEATLENAVIWRRNGKVLDSGSIILNEKNEPHIMVDTFNTLYLIDVTTEDEGNYTCQVDDIRMQQIRIFIVSKTKFLTKEFFRHMMYLAIVLLLSSSCYFAGLFVACIKRRTFKGYKEIKKELYKKKYYMRNI